MEMKLKKKNRPHRCDINRTRSRQGTNTVNITKVSV